MMLVTGTMNKSEKSATDNLGIWIVGLGPEAPGGLLLHKTGAMGAYWISNSASFLVT
jgi:hypothetical protein